MTIETLQRDMITAMKNGEKERKDTLSTLIAATKNLAIAKKCRENIPEEVVMEAILKELKTAKEQVETCPKDRIDLMNSYLKRVMVIEEYAPKMMTEKEVENLILTEYKDVIESKNKGLIMKTIMPNLKGKAEGAVINKVINKLI